MINPLKLVEVENAFEIYIHVCTDLLHVCVGMVISIKCIILNSFVAIKTILYKSDTIYKSSKVKM